MYLFLLVANSQANQLINDLKLTAYVDNNNVHLMWISSNLTKKNTQISIEGPITKTFSTDESHFCIKNLIPGKYLITLLQEKLTSSSEISIQPPKIPTRTKRSVPEVNSLEFIALDDTKYPEILIQFFAKDATDNSLLSLQKSSFSIIENDINIINFDFKPPAIDSLTKISDIVVVFDDTGSMGEEIVYLKNSIYNFVDELVEKGVEARFRLITYKDDAADNWEWVYDTETFKNQIGSLVADGGDDFEEDGFEAIGIAANYSFRSGTQKIFLLFTDAPSWEGTDEYGNETYTKDEIITMLKNRGIILYSIAYNNSQYNGEGSISTETGGKYYPISSNFTEIIEEIGSTVGGAYHIAYKSINTELSLSELNIHHNDSGKELIYNYARNLTPKVNILYYQPLVPIAGENILISVYANDPDHRGIDEVKLKYRTYGESLWNSSTLIQSDSKTNSYTFQINGNQVTGEGIEYYAVASDNEGAISYCPQDTSKPFLISSKKALTIEETSKTINSSEMIIDQQLSGTGSTIPNFSYFPVYNTSTGIVSQNITDNSTGNIYYINLGSDLYRFIFKINELETLGLVGVIIQTELSSETKKTGVIYYNGSDSYIKNKADTIFLTNISKYSSGISQIKNSLWNSSNDGLIQKTWNISDGNIPFSTDNAEYNMLPIIIDLDNQEIIDGGISENDFQIRITNLDGTSMKDSNASTILSRLIDLRDNKGYNNLKYLIILGHHDIIPFGNSAKHYVIELFCNTCTTKTEWDEKCSTELTDSDQINKCKNKWDSEKNWFKSNLYNDDIAKSYEYLYEGQRFPSDYTYRKEFKTGRIIELPSHIESAVKLFINKNGYVLTEKNAMYIGGYDYNNEKEGFYLTKDLKTLLDGNSWKTKQSLYNKNGFTGKAVVDAINSVSSAIIDFEGHGNFDIIDNSNPSTTSGWCKWGYLVDGPFYAKQDYCDGDVLELNSLKDIILLSNACHSGFNFSTGNSSFADFPESFVGDGGDIEENRSLAVYIANNAYGAYSSKETSLGDKSIYNLLNKLISSTSNDDEIYDEFYNNNSGFTSYETETNEYLKSIPQFYGIPNYRRGPRLTLKRTKRSRSENIANNCLPNESNAYISTDTWFSNNGIAVEVAFNITENYIYEVESGRLTIIGIENRDEYNRPVVMWTLPVPAEAEISSITLLENSSNDKNYSSTIVSTICNSENCTIIPVITNNFEVLSRYNAYIEENLLIIKFTPIQYNTQIKKALISNYIKLQLSLTIPEFLIDSDYDGLPDYWEISYGLSHESPNGDNGASGDPDNDSLSNIQEFVEFTNPVCDSSYLTDTTAPVPPEALTVTPLENAVKISLNTDVTTTQIQFYYGTTMENLLNHSSKQSVNNFYELYGLEDNTLYYLSARAFDSTGNMSSASNIISFKTPKGIGPTLPQNPFLNGKTLTVTNPHDDDFIGYNIYIGYMADLSDAKVDFILPSSGPETEISLDLSANNTNSRKRSNNDQLTTMYIGVRAVDENGHEGEMSSILSFSLESSTNDIPKVVGIPVLNFWGITILTILLFVSSIFVIKQKEIGLIVKNRLYSAD